MFQRVFLNCKFSRVGRAFAQKTTSRLFLGDEILAINETAIKNAEHLIANMKKSNQPLVNIKIQRLPFARVIILSDSFKRSPLVDENSQISINFNEVVREKFGIKLKTGTTKIEKIEENGVFFKSGLKYDPNKVRFDLNNKSFDTVSKMSLDPKNRLTKWVITAINGENLSYQCSAQEVIFIFK